MNIINKKHKWKGKEDKRRKRENEEKAVSEKSHISRTSYYKSSRELDYFKAFAKINPKSVHEIHYKAAIYDKLTDDGSEEAEARR